MATIYSQMSTRARGFLTDYTTDLTVHDQGVLKNMEPGTTGVWICRTSGTHLLPFPRIEDPLCINILTNRLTYILHLNALHAGAHWYMFNCTDKGGIGTLSPCSAHEAMMACATRLEEFSRRPVGATGTVAA